MIRVAFEPISQVAITAGERSGLDYTLEWLRGELNGDTAARDLVQSMNQAGFSVQIGRGASGRQLGAEATKREVGQLLDVLGKFVPNARADRSGFESAFSIMKKFAPDKLPADLMTPATSVRAPSFMRGPIGPSARYDLGVSVDERGAVKGLVFNAKIPSRMMARGMTRGVSMERNLKGGLNVDLGPDIRSVRFQKPMTIRAIVQKKIDEGRLDASHAKDWIAALEKAGFDLDAKRSVLVARLEDGTSQLIFFRSSGEQNPNPMSREEKAFARQLGYDPDNAPESVPRDFGIACVDTCVEMGDLLGQRPFLARKPVINVYHPVPGTAVEVEVELANSGYFSSLYPKPADRVGDQRVVWRMKSGGLGGELFDPANERRYPYLYWEAMQTTAFSIDHRQAYCVRGEDAAEFLEKACQSFAFNAKETTDFITYWIAALEQNEYNVIQFLGAEYEAFASLSVTPAPDQVTRVFMIFERSNVPVVTGNPALPEITRHAGFVVTEWGGCNLDETRRLVR